MLITFTTDAHTNNVMMFGDVAQTMLKMMGHSGTVPGAILAADVPAVRDHLAASIEAEKQLHQETDKEGKHVSMAHRALPLLELLTAAVKEDCNVMWR
ncbi:MAG: DUF1840 domain-containing protein [Gallionella sp.]